MVKYNWKKTKHRRRGIGKDNEYFIIIRENNKEETNCALIHKNLIKLLKQDYEKKYVEIFYSEKGYLGFKFSNKCDENKYNVRKESNIRYIILSKLFNFFEGKEYFKEDLIIEDGMVIIKAKLKDKNKKPIFCKFN